MGAHNGVGLITQPSGGTSGSGVRKLVPPFGNAQMTAPGQTQPDEPSVPKHGLSTWRTH